MGHKRVVVGPSRAVTQRELVTHHSPSVGPHIVHTVQTSDYHCDSLRLFYEIYVFTCQLAE